MLCRMVEKKIWMLSLLLAGFMLIALSDMGFVARDEAFAEAQIAAENDRATSISGNQNEIVLPVKLLKKNTFAYIKVPQPEGLVLVPDTKTPHDGTPYFRYVSNLDKWNKISSNKSFDGSLLMLTIIPLGEQSKYTSDSEESQAWFTIFLGSKSIFFGDVPNTYMGYNALENSPDFTAEVFAFTKINNAQVGIRISLYSPTMANEDLEECKKMLEEYTAKIREANKIAGLADYK